jgi:UDP-N-acetylglucosamine--N-acetylmuramyl-(pentapeptide) pyrophosphoryl-undecaprenol N-acetylglucosamine transferase
VCGPVGYAAALTGVPLVVQEQNSIPGATIRILAPKAAQVHVTFETTKRHLRRTDNVVLSGNPTRREIGSKSRAEGAAFFGVDQRQRTLLVFGGSLGAASINSALLGMIDDLQAMSLQVLWQTGDADYRRIQQAMGSRPAIRMIKVERYIGRMEYAYAACDLALCRAGASTLAELMRSGTPAILVPYPFATADHQTENARALVEAGAAVMCADRELNNRLAGLLRELLADEARLRSMAARARALSRPDAAAAIADAVIMLAGRRHDGT